MKDEARRAVLRAVQAAAFGSIAVACTGSTPPSASAEPADCMALTDGAFPDGDPYPYPKAKASPHRGVQACCKRSLETFQARRTPDPVMDRHRWACCASVDSSTLASAQPAAMACTP